MLQGKRDYDDVADEAIYVKQSSSPAEDNGPWLKVLRSGPGTLDVERYEGDDRDVADVNLEGRSSAHHGWIHAECAGLLV